MDLIDSKELKNLGDSFRASNYHLPNSVYSLQSKAPARFFLHRFFISCNIHLKRNERVLTFADGSLEVFYRDESPITRLIDYCS